MNLNKTGQTDLQTGKFFLVQLSLITGGKNKILMKRKLKFTSLNLELLIILTGRKKQFTKSKYI